MYVWPATEPPCRFAESNPQARPIVALAWLYGPKAPMPEFMPISLRMGPLTRDIAPAELVVLPRALVPLAAMARMTGKYSGRAPAMTALMATFSTVYSHDSRRLVGRMRPATA